MKVAIQAKVNYVDLGGLYHKTIEQKRLHAAAKRAGVTCVLGIGSTPGIMNVMAKHAASFLDRVHTMELRCGGKVVEKSRTPVGFAIPYSLKTLIDEVTMKAPILRHGKIKLIKPLGYPLHFTLPKPIGKVNGYYTLHSELATLPKVLKKKGLRQLDFAYAYDPMLIQSINLLAKLGMTNKNPLNLSGCNKSPYDFLAEVAKRLPHPSHDLRDVEVLRVDAWGKRKGKKCFVRVETHAHYHPQWKKSAGSVDTGVPASIIAQWIAQGKLAIPGVWAPEDVIKPLSLFNEVHKQGRGMKAYTRINNKIYYDHQVHHM